jgi:hypothetical protein
MHESIFLLQQNILIKLFSALLFSSTRAELLTLITVLNLTTLTVIYQLKITIIVTSRYEMEPG